MPGIYSKSNFKWWNLNSREVKTFTFFILVIGSILKWADVIVNEAFCKYHIKSPSASTRLDYIKPLSHKSFSSKRNPPLFFFNGGCYQCAVMSMNRAILREKNQFWSELLISANIWYFFFVLVPNKVASSKRVILCQTNKKSNFVIQSTMSKNYTTTTKPRPWNMCCMRYSSKMATETQNFFHQI